MCNWSIFKNLNTWGELWTNQVHEAECCRKATSGGRAASATRFLIETINLQLECATVLHETVLTYGNETMLWKQEVRFRIRAVQITIIRSLLIIWMMDIILIAQIRVFGGIMRGVDERIED